jgi:hypothetical protein
VPNDFISLFIDYNKEFESPESFWKWSAYSLVASTLRMNVYHNAGNDLLYPNIYVLLLADSAAYRKGGPFPLVTDLATELHHTKIYDGRASIQAVLEKLSQDIGGKGGRPIRGGCCLILAEELAAFFVGDTQLVPLITNIYRSRKIFNYDLRGNAFTIKDLCVSMLSASNETNLRDVYNAQAAYGGLLGRTFLVKPSARRPGNSLLRVDVTKYDKKPLSEALKDISNLKGAVTFTDEAVDVYERWYKKLYDDLPKLNDPAGVMGRMHTGVVKLSMIIAASNYSTEITKAHMELAIEEVIALRPNYESYVVGTGASPYAKIASLLVQALYVANQNGHGGRLPRSTFLMNNWNQITTEDFNKTVVDLTQAGMLTEVHHNNELCYVATQRCLDIFQKHTNKPKPKGNTP